jgi:macrolide-specific efflux system membrane fusion protein
VRVDRHRGEWVEPGDPVLRILRIDRLRAEGFVKVHHTEHDLENCLVTLKVNLPGEPGAVFPGKVVFLSPEVDPVNAQVRIWAEIENRGTRLRPGMRATMSIHVKSPEPLQP